MCSRADLNVLPLASGLQLLWLFHTYLSQQPSLPAHSAHISLLTKLPCSDSPSVWMRSEIHKGHFLVAIPFVLFSELCRSDPHRGDIIFSEKEPPCSLLWCRYQLLRFIREAPGWLWILRVSCHLGSCSGGVGRYQVWPANIPASGAKALWSPEKMSLFKETSLQLSPGYLVEVRELICNHETQPSHLLPTPGRQKHITPWCRGFESIAPNSSQQELSALGLQIKIHCTCLCNNKISKWDAFFFTE